MKTHLIRAKHHKNRVIKCSITDHFAFRMPVPVVFYYRKHIPSRLILEALEHVLGDFPIFAGTLIKIDGHLHIDCNNRGVSVKIAEASDKLIDILNPKKTTTLLNVQLTYFPDRMTLGFCWHHSVGDMATFMEFVKALSAHAQGKSYQLPLIVEDREASMPLTHKTADPGLKRLGLVDFLRFIKQILSPKRTIQLYFTPEELFALKSSNESRSDALCAHILTQLAQFRNEENQSASILINIRSRLKLPSNLLGNFLDLFTVRFAKSEKALAAKIHEAKNNYKNNRFCPSNAFRFVQNNGGIEKIGQIIPRILLPENKNLLITNWSNFGVYSIDFGLQAPYSFRPIVKSFIPWVMCIVEGPENKGLFVTLVLPSNIAKQLRDRLGANFSRRDRLDAVARFI